MYLLMKWNKEDEVKTLKIIVFIILSFVFMMYGVGYMMTRGINNTLLDQEFYRNLINDNEIPTLVHGKIVDLIPEVVRNGITGGTTITDAAQKAVVDAQTKLISNAITDALDETWLEKQATKVTDDLVKSLNDAKATSMTVVLDLTDRLDIIKQNIAKGLETYSDAELMAMFGAPKSYIPAISDQIVGKLGLPENLPIGSLVDSAAPGTIPMVHGYLDTLHTIFSPIMKVIVVLVFFVLCLLAFRLKNGLKWFGISIALSGVSFIVVRIFASSLDWISSVTGIDFSTLPVPSETLQNVVSSIFNEMNVLPLLCIAVGIVLFIVSLIIPTKAENE